MRRLNGLLRSLSRSLHDAWKLVRAQVSTPADPKKRLIVQHRVEWPRGSESKEST